MSYSQDPKYANQYQQQPNQYQQPPAQEHTAPQAGNAQFYSDQPAQAQHQHQQHQYNTSTVMAQQPAYNQQPQVVAPMTSQYPGGTTGYNGGGDREWENTMCSCCSPANTCCLGYCCPCILYSKIQHRTRDGRMEDFSACNGACMAWTAVSCFGFQWIMSMIQRGDIRAKYHLQGSGCGDCTRHYWCECCTLIQEEKETLLLAERQRGTNTVGFQQQQKMSYP